MSKKLELEAKLASKKDIIKPQPKKTTPVPKKTTPVPKKTTPVPKTTPVVNTKTGSSKKTAVESSYSYV